MVSFNISYDGGITSTANFTATALLGEDAFRTSAAPGAIALIVLSFLALVLSIPALFAHIKSRSFPATSMVLWIVLMNVFNIVNAFVWSDDNVGSWWSGQGYCDVETKLDVAGNMGLIGSLACIMRGLARALDTDNPRLSLTAFERRRERCLEFLYCIGFPLCLCAMHFVIQPFRYYIFAIAGCVPAYSSSWLGIMLLYVWPPVVSLISGYFAILLIVRAWRYHHDFASILASSSSGMTKSRFVRLFASASILLLMVIPVQGYALYRNTSSAITTWDWTSTHNPMSFQTIVYVLTYGKVYEDRWIRAAEALPVFICFGWGRDAKAMYRSWLLLLKFDKLFPSLRPGTNGGRGAPSLSVTASTSTIATKVRTFLSRTSSRNTGRAANSNTNSTIGILGQTFAQDDVETQDFTIPKNAPGKASSIPLKDMSNKGKSHSKVLSFGSSITVMSNGTILPRFEREGHTLPVDHDGNSNGKGNFSWKAFAVHRGKPVESAWKTVERAMKRMENDESVWEKWRELGLSE